MKTFFLFKDFQALLDHNIKSSLLRSSQYWAQNHTNETYELPHRTYLNCKDEFGGMFYDSPRKLTPTTNKTKEEDETVEKGSPLQSPTDSESVFTDDDWTHNTSGDLSNKTKFNYSDVLLKFLVLL